MGRLKGRAIQTTDILAVPTGVGAETRPAPGERVGLAVVGAGGAVATTVAAGLELIRSGAAGTAGLPLAQIDESASLCRYGDIVTGGWDVHDTDFFEAARYHQVLTPAELAVVAPVLQAIRPWPAIADDRYTPAIGGDHRRGGLTDREAVDAIHADLAAFRDLTGVARIVVANLASTERSAPDGSFEGLDGLEQAIDSGRQLSPAMLYAYSAITFGAPVLNFTPSVCVEHPALVELAMQHGVPTAGRDGKTGQTFLKTALAPALRDRNLHVDGWFSTNILGNRDGAALRDPGARAQKVTSKQGVLESILGYDVDHHVVRIDFYRPRGDDKEAWDVVDFSGFLDRRMQLRMNLQCSDSLLAAPLVIELTRLLDLAARRGLSGPVPELGYFFKDPDPFIGGAVDHDLFRQHAALLAWLRG